MSVQERSTEAHFFSEWVVISNFPVERLDMAHFVGDIVNACKACDLLADQAWLKLNCDQEGFLIHIVQQPPKVFMVKLLKPLRFGVTDDSILRCIMSPTISCKSKDGKSWRKYKLIVTAVPPGVEGWIHRASLLFVTGIGSYNAATMDTSRLVLGRLLMECHMPPLFLLPIYFKHSRGVSPHVIEGSEPLFIVIAENPVMNRRELLVAKWNELNQLNNTWKRPWHDGFSFRYYTWRYQFYSSLHEAILAPDIAFLFEKTTHIKLEGISPLVNISTLIAAVGTRMVDLTFVGHVFIRTVKDKPYLEAFICVVADTFIDLSLDSLRALNLAHLSFTLKGAIESTLTGKNDIDWYIVNRRALSAQNSLGSSTSIGSSIRAGGRIPGGRGGGSAVGRRISPIKSTVNATVRPWTEVVVDRNKEIQSLKDQIKLLTDKVGSLLLRK